jgi:hypothetical protein
MHDVGAAAWFGGSLMGAVALNGASKDIADPAERAQVASVGWARWSPVAAAAVGAHLLGGIGLIRANRARLGVQRGVRANTAFKSLLTGAAVATTAYSGLIGARVLKAGPVPDDGATVPGPLTPEETARNQQRLRVLQWATPALTGLIVVLGAQQGEQQRPTQVAKDLARQMAQRAADATQRG